METPLSMRRITRSQAAASAQKRREEEGQASRTKAKSGERAALLDITNDSPIVGVAAGGLVTARTPASASAAKGRPRPRQTPGSGEALLRGQVKTLLQKVEEEGGAVVKPAAAHLLPFRGLLGVSRSPAQLLAPTPANTPQVGSVSSERDGFVADDMMMPSVVEEEDLLPNQGGAALNPPEGNLGECLPTRALMFDDSPEKSDSSNGGSVVSSSLTFQQSGDSYLNRSPDDDNSSAWSIQVNASSEKGDCDCEDDEELLERMEEEEVVVEEHDDEQEGQEEFFDELCDCMNKMSVFDVEEEEERVGLPEFKGKHTRFIYNSDDELEVQEEKSAAAATDEGVVVLRGLPVPEGKHLRFQEEEEE